MPHNNFDIIVLGLGAMGSATLYQLAKRGARVLGIDQFSPPHTFGSSHGDSRITRLAIGEGAHFVPLVVRSHDIWRALETETGTALLHTTGALILGENNSTATMHGTHFLATTIAAAEQYQIPHEIVNAAQIRTRFPQFTITDHTMGYYEPGAGAVYADECVRTQLALAHKYGAAIHTNERVERFSAHNKHVQVVTTRGSYDAAQLIICAGPWLPALLAAQFAQHFTVRRQVLYWFAARADIALYLPENCPVFIMERSDGRPGIYGFPAFAGAAGGVKIATEQYETITTPDTVNRIVTSDEIATMYRETVAPYVPGLSERCINAATCLYTLTRDFGFVIDQHPEFSNVTLVSPCSGHGFKHSAAIGEALAERALDGRSTIDLTPFAFARSPY